MARQQEAGGELVTVGGVTFQRWCPHAREDLSFATLYPKRYDEIVRRIYL
mgnify:CR=1 FL=1